MLHRIVSLLLLLLLSLCVKSNNLNLGSAVKILDVSSSEATLEISLNWENSWRDNYNNDAVWIFFKYRTTASNWEAVLLPDKAEVDNTFTVMPGYSAGEVVGYFVYRSTPGSGDASTKFTFKWRYPSHLNRTMLESNEVFLMAQGIEMVYVPYGSYTLGDGSSNKSFTDSRSAGVEITSKNAVDLSVLGNGGTRRIAPPYPSGYEGCYIMKYELSQEQYVAFLNSLSRESQLDILPRLVSLKKGEYVFGSPSAPTNRNGIIVAVPMTDSKAAVLDNNLHNDNTYGSQDDGRTLACNYMSINDLLGYMSWSGLRPLSELEYEKTCRRLSPYHLSEGEYAWGTTALSSMTGIVDETSGWADESPNDGWANAEGRFGLYPGSGPVRCGAFASIASNRESAGSTYCGVMEMSGNLGELCLNTTSGSLNFDGSLHGSGEYYTGEWGNLSPSCFGLRGGSFSSAKERLRVSDRTDMESGYFTSVSMRDSTVGFRGLRMLDRTKLGFTPGKIQLKNAVSTTVCSGMPFTVENAASAGSAVLSGLLVTYRWYVNGKEIARETGESLTYPVGIYNTSMEDSVYRFTRRVSCALGELETEAVVITVPGKLKLSLPVGESQLRLSCNVTSPVTASRLSDTRFRWVNGSEGKIVRDWSSVAKSDVYSPLHKDFGYMGAVRKLRCVSDVGGCRDSVEISLTVESSCYLTVDSSLLHMTTNVNGGTAVASLCGPGTVSWYYKDGGGDEHLIGSSTAVAAPNGGGTPLAYTVSYKPKYSDFKNTIGMKTVVVRSNLGDNDRCRDVQELVVDVKATLDAGKISAPALACGNTELTVNNDKVAGVDGMDGLNPVYSWYLNGSSVPLVNENGPTLKYRLPANTSDRAVNYTFVRKAVTAAPPLQTPEGVSVTVVVPGVPSVTITTPAAVCEGTSLPLQAPSVNWAGLNGNGAWMLNGGAVPNPVTYANNGQELVYSLTNSCHSIKSNSVNITVNAKPTVGVIAKPVAICAGNALPYPATPSVVWNGLTGSVAWKLNGGNVPNPVQYVNNDQTLTYTATNGCGTTISNGVTITVKDKPVIAALTAPAAVCAGNALPYPATPAVTWKGETGSVAWRLNNVAVPNPVQVGHNGQILTYVATNSCGTTVSNGMAITVNAVTTLTKQPAAQTICQGNTISLSTAATGTNIAYQWQKNNANIGGATAASYSKGGGVPGDGGTYRCYVTGTCGAVYTNAVAVTVNATTAITSQPAGQTLCQGNTISLSTAATGANVAYQWQKNNASIGGATGTSYSKGGAVPGDGGSYRCYITGTCGTVYTNTVTVTVYSPTVLTSNPSGSKIRAGETFAVAVGATGSNLGYQWQLNNGNIAGATASTYTRTNAPAAASGAYRCYVSGSCGSLYSNAATVTVVDWRNAGWSMTNDCVNCTYQQAIDRCNALGKRLPNNDDWWALPPSANNVLSLSIGTGYWSITKSGDHPVGDDWATFSGAGGYGNCGHDNTSTTLTFSVRCVNR